MPTRLSGAALLLLVPTFAYGASHYERHHPDIHFREQALAALDAGDVRRAFDLFREASRWADKPAQAMVAEAYADGRGVERDPVLAYIWMDLAAERGYALFVGKREHYWQRLDAAQRSRVLTLGRALYDEFGDDVAKPRLEEQLRRGKRDSPGSRVGAATAFVDIYTNINRGNLGSPFAGTPAPRYYAPRFWNAEDYWRAVDADWSRLPAGIVEVKPLAPKE